MRFPKINNLLMFVLLFSSPALSGDIVTVSTFECTSIYFKSVQRGDCKVFYKQFSEDKWNQALDLVFDERDEEYRGSIVDLQTNTEYNIRLQFDSGEILGKAKSTLD